jgi:hypothetical protein
MINAPLWSELFLANKKELLLHITAFEKSLQSVRRMIQDGDASALQDTLRSAREKRIAMSRVEQKSNQLRNPRFVRGGAKLSFIRGAQTSRQKAARKRRRKFLISALLVFVLSVGIETA